MCKSPPGFRCSGHLLDERDTCQDRVRKIAKDLSAALSRDEDTTKLLAEQGKAVAKLSTVLEEYSLTKHYQNDLKTKMASMKEANLEGTTIYAKMKNQLAVSESNRAIRQGYINMNRVAQKRIAPYKEALDKMEKDSLAELKTANNAVFNATKVKRGAAKKVEKSKEEVARIYRAAGMPLVADYPGRWTAEDFGGKDTLDGSNPYTTYTEARTELEESETALKNTLSPQRVAALQAAYVEKMVYKRRAQIASGIEPGDTYAAHGQTYIEPDGKTNAYYLTKIPGTQMGIYARVNSVETAHSRFPKLDGGSFAKLETGEEISLSRSNPGDFLFKVPAANSEKGSEVFRPDSSD